MRARKVASKNPNQFDWPERLTWVSDPPMVVAIRAWITVMLSLALVVAAFEDLTALRVIASVLIVCVSGCVLLATYSDWTPGYTWRYLRWLWRGRGRA